MPAHAAVHCERATAPYTHDYEAADTDEEDRAVEASSPDQPVSFEEHVKPLFRERDHTSMRFAFDLWSHEDVSEHADAILGAIKTGSMPCDGAWPPDQVEILERWIAGGKPA
jgi:hypothetical protein